MVKQEGKLWKCEACDMKYKTRDIAKKCEEFCKKHKSCNTELIKEAVE